MDWATLAWPSFITLLLEWGIFTVTTVIGSRPGAKRNAWAGIRIPSTMESDEAWVAGHTAALSHIKIESILLLPLAVIALFFLHIAPAFVGLLETLFAGVAFVWMLIIAVIAGRAANVVNSRNSATKGYTS